MKIHSFSTDFVQLNIEDDEEFNKAFAALSLNPTIKWIKFVLTDDKANANKQRIPKDEFTNLIKTGVHMPIKMGMGYIRKGHEFAVPIGTITGLAEQNDQIIGIAALWTREHENEINIIEAMKNDENSPQISWEILYRESSIDEDGVEDLRGTVLSAATVVGDPAYQGRTRIVQVASRNKNDNPNEEEDSMETVEELQEALETSEANIEELENENKELKETVESLNDEIKPLKEFKEEVEAERARAAKIDQIVALYEEHGLNLPEDYFEDEEKAEKLLNMSLEQLEFMIQNFAYFQDASEGDEDNEDLDDADAGNDRPSVPNLTGKRGGKLTPEEIAEELKKRDKGEDS